MRRAKQRTRLRMASLRFQWKAGPIIDATFTAYVDAFHDGPKAQFKAMGQALMREMAKMAAASLAKQLFDNRSAYP